MEEQIQNIFGCNISNMLAGNINISTKQNQPIKVDTFKTLKKCHEELKDRRLKINTNLSRKINSALHDNLNKKENTDVIITYCKMKTLPEKSDLNIIFGPPKVPNLPTFQRQTKLKRSHILNNTEDGTELFEKILNITSTKIRMGHKTKELLLNTLRKLKKNHDRMKYYLYFNELKTNKKYERLDEWEDEVTKKDVRSFLIKVTHKVIPIELFGKQNKTVINKGIKIIVHSAKFEYIELEQLINRIRFDKIEWLKFVNRETDNKTVKKQLMAKIMKWFYIEFIMQVLFHHFHVLPKGTGRDRLYTGIIDWKKREMKFENDKCREKIYQNLGNKNTCKTNELCLIPKKTGLRPIINLKCTSEKKKRLQIIGTLLRQMHLSINGWRPNLFQNDWMEIINMRNQNPDEKIHFVSCDIVDAYGSVNQNILYNILEHMFKQFPRRIKCQTVITVKPNSRFMKYRPCFINENLNLPFGFNTLYTCKNGTENWHYVYEIFEELKTYLFSTEFTFRNNKYRLMKGLVQGFPLSPILAEIYYVSMVNHKLTFTLKNGILCKYVDDILFATKNEKCAVRFLNMVNNGIMSYNCIFDKKKIQTNVSYLEEKSLNNISYLGYQINTNNLEIEPRFKLTTAKYNITIRPKFNDVEIMRKKMISISYLKLNHLILSSKVNSLITIQKNLSKIIYYHAARCCAVIECCIIDFDLLAETVFYNLLNCNNKLLKIIIRFYLESNPQLSLKSQKILIQWLNRKILIVCARTIMKNKRLHAIFNKFLR